MENLNKRDLTLMVKIWKEQFAKTNDIELEELAGEYSEKADEYEEKGKEDKASDYYELSEKLQNLATALQEFYEVVVDEVE